MKISALRIGSEKKSQMLWKDIIQRNAHFEKTVELGEGKKTAKDWRGRRLKNLRSILHSYCFKSV